MGGILARRQTGTRINREKALSRAVIFTTAPLTRYIYTMQQRILNHCPCGSAILHANCCAQYITKRAHAPSAETLMRSRYCAYTEHNGLYLLATWHQRTRPTTLNLLDDSHTEWLGLKVCGVEAGGTNDVAGTVEFIAHYKCNETTEVIHETSRFVKEEGRWYYVDGTLSKPTKNSPCPCGSGKKFKRCCSKTGN